MPAIHPFIIIRPERFGALVFNRFQGLDVELDKEEAYIVDLCDGSRPRCEIEGQACERFKWGRREGKKRVDDTLGKLSDIYAIGLYSKRRDAKPKKEHTARFDAMSSRLSAPKNVTWEVTYACNLRCRHCFTAAGKKARGELTTEQALAVVDELASMRVFTVLLSGGEPFLRPDIMTLLKRIASAHMRIDIGTNGYDVPDDTIRRLWTVPVSHTHVSIDGIGARHDNFRGRKGAFEKACGTIAKLREYGIPVSISTAVTAENIHDLGDIINLAVELKCKGFKAIPFFPVGRGKDNARSLSLKSEDFFELYRLLLKRSGELKGRISIYTGTCFPFLLEGRRNKVEEDGPMGCSAGDDTLLIGADGMIYPCPYLRDFPLGNALAGGIPGIWKDATVLQVLRSLRKKEMEEPCRSCAYAPKPCGGGCRAAAYLAYGDLRSWDPSCTMPLIERRA